MPRPTMRPPSVPSAPRCGFHGGRVDRVAAPRNGDHAISEVASKVLQGDLLTRVADQSSTGHSLQVADAVEITAGGAAERSKQLRSRGRGSGAYEDDERCDDRGNRERSCGAGPAACVGRGGGRCCGWSHSAFPQRVRRADPSALGRRHAALEAGPTARTDGLPTAAIAPCRGGPRSVLALLRRSVRDAMRTAPAVSIPRTENFQALPSGVLQGPERDHGPERDQAQSRTGAQSPGAMSPATSVPGRTKRNSLT